MHVDRERTFYLKYKRHSEKIKKKILKLFICDELILIYESGYLQDFIIKTFNDKEFKLMALSRIEKIFINYALKKWKEERYKKANRAIRQEFVKVAINGVSSKPYRDSVRKDMLKTEVLSKWDED
tara:strand:+ start:1827 stop:2201 length:375 start_codon:yes stop_codon:yes gene_type:complete